MQRDHSGEFLLTKYACPCGVVYNWLGMVWLVWYGIIVITLHHIIIPVRVSHLLLLLVVVIVCVRGVVQTVVFFIMIIITSHLLLV